MAMNVTIIHHPKKRKNYVKLVIIIIISSFMQSKYLTLTILDKNNGSHS